MRAEIDALARAEYTLLEDLTEGAVVLGSPRLRLIFDFDGTLTHEHRQAALLREKALEMLAGEILRVPLAGLKEEYARRRNEILSHPWQYGWRVNGQLAAYADEGAYILNTTITQELLKKPAYLEILRRRYRNAPYDPVSMCTNELFHTLTADLPPFFREETPTILENWLSNPVAEVVVLTNSRGDKVKRYLTSLGLPYTDLPQGAPWERVRVLGDVRQYDMTPAWPAENAPPAFLEVDSLRRIDLRRPVYYGALQRERTGTQLVIIADGLSLAGALPLALNLPFILMTAPYTPAWAIDVVRGQPTGRVMDRLDQIEECLDSLDIRL